MLAEANGLRHPSYSEADHEYRRLARNAGALTAAVTLLVALALVLPWFTYGTLTACPCSAFSCVECPGAQGPSPFSDSNWYLPTAPAGSGGQLLWSFVFLMVVAALLLGAGATSLYSLMASGKALRWRLGTYAWLTSGGAVLTAGLAASSMAAWMWQKGVLWGSSRSWDQVATWGPGLGWYICTAAAVLCLVGFLLARSDLGQGEIFFDGRSATSEGGPKRRAKRAPTGQDPLGV